jgi:ABC-type sugar transport system substrate-binding protein
MKKRTERFCIGVLLAAAAVFGLIGCAKKTSSSMKIAVLPKMVGENYWDAVQTGCEEAIEELKGRGIAVEMIYDGPPQDQATNQRQAELLEGWIAQGVDLIVSASVDSAALTPTMKKAKDAGIKVVMFDSGVAPEAQDLFIVQVVPEGMGRAVLGAAADQLKAKGYGPSRPVNIAMMGQTKTDANINSWINAVRDLLATPEYNWIRLQNEDTDIYYPGADETRVSQDASTLLSRMGPGANQIQCALGMTSMTAPALGAAYEAAAQKPDKNAIVLTGVATPNALNSYIMDDSNPVEAGILWNCMDLGYLSVMTGYQLTTGEINPDSPSVTTPRMGTREINNRVIIFSDPMVFDKTTVNNFNY